MPYFDEPAGRFKIQKTNKGTQHFKTFYKLFIIQLLDTMHISNKAGKAKYIEKRSTHSRPVKQALFTVRNNKLLRDICTLFADYLYSTQLGNKLKYTLTLISGM